MGELAGYGGNFYVNATVGKSSPASITTVVAGIKNWTVSYTADAHEITDFANTERAYIPGLVGWTGTAAGLYNSSVSYNATYKPGQDFSARFDMGSSKEIIGDIIITGANYGTDTDGAITVDFAFQGTGALTIG